MPTSEQELLGHIRFCEQRADELTGRDRQGWLDLAASWRKLIAQRERAAAYRQARTAPSGS